MEAANTSATPQPSSLGAITLATLRALVADLAREYPQAGPRLAHAAFIVAFREVERGADLGHWWVQSETDPNAQYLVRRPAGQPPTCTCQDHARRGELTPCKHLLATLLLDRCERLEAQACDPTPAVEMVDVSGEPIPYSLTPLALATLDDYRQRSAARCPDCGTWKQHGHLTCGGDRCERAPIALNLPA